jgi:hypothetical protein
MIYEMSHNNSKLWLMNREKDMGINSHMWTSSRCPQDGQSSVCIWSIRREIEYDKPSLRFLILENVFLAKCQIIRDGYLPHDKHCE